VVPELVRRYAAEQLALRPDDDEEVRARHAAYYTAMVQRCTMALLPLGQGNGMSAGDQENVQAAWERAVCHVRVNLIGEMGTALSLWYELTGRYDDAVAMFGWAVERLRAGMDRDGTPAPLLQGALQVVALEQARFLLRQGRYGQVRPLLEEACGVARPVLSTRAEAYPVLQSGGRARTQGGMAPLCDDTRWRVAPRVRSAHRIST
jgi:hypothetical protein